MRFFFPMSHLCCHAACKRERAFFLPTFFGGKYSLPRLYLYFSSSSPPISFCPPPPRPLLGSNCSRHPILCHPPQLRWKEECVVCLCPQHLSWLSSFFPITPAFFFPPATPFNAKLHNLQYCHKDCSNIDYRVRFYGTFHYRQLKFDREGRNLLLLSRRLAS